MLRKKYWSNIYSLLVHIDLKKPGKLQMQDKGNTFNMELIKLKTYLLSLYLKITTLQKISFI